MHSINILEDNPTETILAFIEDQISTHQIKYILVSFNDKIKNSNRKKVVDRIKSYFDIFVVLKTDVPKQQQQIEEYFSYGVHGIYFNLSQKVYDKKQLDIMSFATDLFSRGWVFAGTQNDEGMIEELLNLKIIPVPVKYDGEITDFIKSHSSFKKISPNLKSVPLVDQEPCEYSFTDRIKMKMLLESMNLRQKLMVKSVDESFASSGL